MKLFAIVLIIVHVAVWIFAVYDAIMGNGGALVAAIVIPIVICVYVFLYKQIKQGVI